MYITPTHYVYMITYKEIPNKSNVYIIIINVNKVNFFFVYTYSFFGKSREYMYIDYRVNYLIKWELLYLFSI